MKCNPRKLNMDMPCRTFRYGSYILLGFCFVVLEFKLSTSCTLGKFCTIELDPWPLEIMFWRMYFKNYALGLEKLGSKPPFLTILYNVIYCLLRLYCSSPTMVGYEVQITSTGFLSSLGKLFHPPGV
jgi:hypothetical protein